MNTVKLPAYLRLVLILLGVFITLIIMMEAKAVLVPLLVSGLLAVLVSPFTSWLERKKVPSVLAVGISVVALLSFITGLLFFFYNQLLGFAQDIHLLERRASELINEINILIEANFEGAVPISMSQIKDVAFEYLSENILSLTQGIMATAATITMLFIIPIYIFLFLYYRRFLVTFVLRAFGEKNNEKVSRIIHNVQLVVKNYITGMFIVIVILAVLNTAMLLSFDIQHALLFGVFAALLNIIPFLGPFIGSALPIFYALLTKDTLWYPFGVFLGFYVIQLFESNLFTPRIVGGKVSMNPLMTIIALFIGNFIWGLAGMILFIPGIAILKVILDEIPGMEPYGFLLGSASKRKQKESIKIKKDRSLREKLSDFRISLFRKRKS